MSDTPKIIDLDALLPAKVIVKLDGAEIEILPPKFIDTLRLGKLGRKLQNIETLSDDEAEKVLTDLTNEVKKNVPALVNKELHSAQLLQLVTIISDMSVPPDAKELKARGITADTPKATA